MLGICKGLHYSLWMQDKLLLKEQTVTRFCNLLREITDDALVKYYIFGMFEILAREWDKLDNWRMDKFMLLARDFFNCGLSQFSQIKPQLWDSFIEGLFLKVLNKDFNHAVGLKMHFCNLLGEELYKKRIKPLFVQSIFKSITSLLAALPKHNIYSHAVLKLMNQLCNIVKKYPISIQEEITAFLMQLISHPCPFRNALKSATNNLKSVVMRKLKSNKAANSELNESLEKSSVCLTEFHPNVTSASSAPTEIPVAKPEPVVTKKLKKNKLKKQKLKNKLAKPMIGKKRKLGVDPEFDSEKLISNPPKKRKKVAVNNSASVIQTSVMNQNDKNKMKSPIELGDTGPATKKPVTLTKMYESFEVHPQTPDIHGKTSVADSSKATTPILTRRVSFGKVFRKKFDAARGISMTPPVNSNPVKGILRTKVQNLNEGRGRLSL